MKFSVLHLVLSIPCATAFGVVGSYKPTLALKTTTQLGYKAEDDSKSCPFSHFLIDGSDAYSEANRFRKPTMAENINQKIQIHSIKHPNGILANTIQPLISRAEGIQALDNGFVINKRGAFGENFCVAGQVCIGDWETGSIGLTSPQARSNSPALLGTVLLNNQKLPMQDTNLFLLALSQEGAGGDGSHEAYRAVLFKYVMDIALERQSDPVAQKLMDQLVEDYSTMAHGRGEAFFTSAERGLNPFLSKYIHYCMFDIDPQDKETVDTLTSFYFSGPFPCFNLFDTIGAIVNFLPENTFSLREEVLKIYENSPRFAQIPEDSVLSKKELSQMLFPLMMLAGMVGPQHLAQTCLGEKSIPSYNEGVGDTTMIKPTETWDKIDLDDPTEVIQYMLECGRLCQPVNFTHRVATESFSVEMHGKKHTFPKGTVIQVPITMSSLNKNLYGETTFEFDHTRPNLVETSTIFNAVGQDKSGGRVCPGTGFTMNMMSEVISKLGKTRRA
jgi:hypothetical protein